jgi:hypothetical protein
MINLTQASQNLEPIPIGDKILPVETKKTEREAEQKYQRPQNNGG